MKLSAAVVLLILFAEVVLVFDSCTEDNLQKHPGKKYLGLSIDNGPRQGFQYFDPSMVEYNYRYITTTVTNDSVVPVNLKFSFPEVYDHPCSDDNQKFRIFLLPRELTPDKQQYDDSMSKELITFLDTNTAFASSFNRRINPKEKLILTFGIITPKGSLDPFQIALISRGHDFKFNLNDGRIKNLISTSDPFTLFLGLDFSSLVMTDSLRCYSVIPCAKISF